MSGPSKTAHPLTRLPIMGPLLRGVYVRAALYYLGVVRPKVHRHVEEFKRKRTRTAAKVVRRNTRRAYERLYADDALLGEYLAPSRIAFYEKVAEAVVAIGCGRILDVGCGTGHLLRAIAERCTGVELAGIDYSSNAIERARSIVPQAKLRVADATRLELPERFDVVLCTEVLEHVKNPTTTVRSLVRATAPGGRIVITVPDGALDSWEGHRNFWTENELQAFLEVVGTTSVSRLDDGTTLLAVVAPRL